MADSKKVVREKVRTHYMGEVKKFLEDSQNDVLVVGSNEFAVPVVREDGEEDYLVITFKLPLGSRDGEPYDGYALAEDYALKQKVKAEKAEASAKAKAKKIERDAKAREAKKGAK